MSRLGITTSKRARRAQRWVERALLGAMMSGIAFVIERRLLQTIKRAESAKPMRPGAIPLAPQSGELAPPAGDVGEQAGRQ